MPHALCGLFLCNFADCDSEASHRRRKQSEQLSDKDGLCRYACEHLNFFDGRDLTFDYAAFDFQHLCFCSVLDDDLGTCNGVFVRERNCGGTFEYFFESGIPRLFESTDEYRVFD